jgi:hypothetical protein
VDPAEAERAIASQAEPAVDALPGLLDAPGVASRVRRDLRRLYRDRLRDVVMIGAWARGDAHPESELELLVVLDDVPDRWEERRRMDRLMWRHSMRNDTVVICAPVTESDLARGGPPPLARAMSEGVPSGAAELPLGRGREELKAAEALLEAGFPARRSATPNWQGSTPRRRRCRCWASAPPRAPG